MQDVNALMAILQAHLKWHRARLFVLSALVLALLRLRTVSLASLACTLHPKRSAETNYRRLQRFFALFRFDLDALAELLLALRVSREPMVLVMDRTEWHFGARTINLLVVGYLESGIVVPLLWQELDKAGATSEEERIALLRRVLALVEPRRVEAFVADREFIGEQFFCWLCRQNFRFVIRIRKKARLYHRGRRTTKRADEVFACLAEERRLRDRHLVYGTHVYVVAARQGKDPWILVTNARPAQARALYRKRWSVETMFGAFKSRGFDLEATHMTEGNRLEKLVGVLALALVWALRVGLWRAEQVVIVVKKHGRRAKSLFRHGLDYLREHLLNHNWAALRPAFQVLSCTEDTATKGLLRHAPPGLRLQDIQPEHVRPYVLDQSVSAATRRHRYRHLRTFFNWAIDADFDLKRAEGYARNGEIQWLKDLILVGVCTGLRRGELCSLRWSQVDFDSGFVFIKIREAKGADQGFQTKNAAERPVPLVGDALTTLQRMRSEREDDLDGPVFTYREGRSIVPVYASKRFKKYVRLCRLSEEITFHTLRHTCASWLVMRGVPLRIVQEILGHSSVQVTQRYAHLAPDAMKQAMQQAFGNL